MTDYLQDAPESVIEAFARMVFTKILYRELEYSEEIIRWLNAPEFSEKNRPLYLERNSDIGSEEGEHKSLQEAVDRLVEKGLIERDPSIMVLWTKEPETNDGG